MKDKKNFFLAFAPFLMVMSIMMTVPNVVYIVLTLVMTLIHGTDGAYYAYDLYMEQLNLVSCIIYLLAFIPAAVWYYQCFYKKGPSLRENRRFDFSSVSFITILALGVSHGISLLFIIINLISPQTMEDYSELMTEGGITSYSFAWALSVLILAPLVEELLFRGLILRYFEKSGISFFLANALQAVLFGVFHMNLVQGIYAFMLGILMGFLAKRYKTLLAPMVFHGCFNLFGTVLSEWESLYLSDLVAFLLMIVGIFLTIGMILVIHMVTRTRTEISANRTLPPRTVVRTGLLQNPYEGLE